MDTLATEYITSIAEKAQVDEQFGRSWYCIIACAFAACNQGKYVADVYTKAIEPLENDEAKREVLCRIKESLLKTAVIYGIPRCINAFRALVKAIPDPTLNETSSIRTHIATPSTLDDRGLDYMRTIFRADLDPFLTTMNTYWPDLRTLVVTTIYGYYQSDVSVINAVTTSMLNIATLIPMDVPSEVGWHMRGLVRNGGSEEQMKFAVDVTNEVCRITGVQLKNRMPLPREVVDEERLF